MLTIKVDGVDRFAAVASDWRGFDPGQMLGPLSPLIPEPFGRRVALCRCSCGEAGCGVMAPLIVESPDGRTISWLDFRDYVGVFGGPTVAEDMVEQLLSVSPEDWVRTFGRPIG